ncbi:MAG: hypothetical protein ACFFDT_28320, partial [Candidatus Hodarchaeota archaeon]
NEALYEAMKKWIEDESPETEVDRDRLLNNATYRQLIPDLVERHRGKWVVISAGELIGIYPDQRAAINAVKEAEIVHKCNIVSPITDRKRKVTLGFGRKHI